ncbi:MAG: ParM/StbA family protein [Clostridia bacterium]|nr:ParM/StbA family protein [Clostridia bacterium]MDD3231918.1 ParM/StbA family protein [Clostridia bacterium]MDD3862484.1 ParM/StbA family protein [Clostridia bacterium]MDD4408694.1 ParM/StbA family protein [Clostridia bacterium]
MKKEKKTSEKSPYEGKNYTKVVGIDVANSTIKVWTDNEKNLKYRNTIKEINDAGLVYSFKTDYQMYVYNKEVYEVGDIAAMGSGSRAKGRYDSNAFKIEALIGITSILEPNTKEKIRLVTGLPSSLAKNEAIKEAIKANLIGEHTLKSVKWDQVDTITFEIVEVIVVPQPLGTLYNFVYDSTTKELNQKYLAQRALVVDIGWGSLDLAVLESFRVRGTFGFDIGVSDYISDLQEDVNNKYPEASIYTLNPHELDLALLESEVVETPFGKYDLSKFVEKHKAIQAKRVHESTMGLGLEFNKFYRIILTGGGSLQYEKYLKELFNDPRLIIQENAVMANVRGFYLLGQF